MKSVRPRLQQRIGQVVRHHREAKKWSQEAFADHIKMHRAQYGFLEQGKRDLRLSSLERVAEGLGVPLWMLVREAEDL